MSCGGSKEVCFEKTPVRRKCACMKNIEEIKKLLKCLPSEPPCQSQSRPSTPPNSPMSKRDQCMYDNVSLKADTCEESCDKIYKDQNKRLLQGSCSLRTPEGKEPSTCHHHKQSAHSTKESGVCDGCMHHKPAKIEQKESRAFNNMYDKKLSCCGTTAGETTPKAGYADCASYCEKIFMEKYKESRAFNNTYDKKLPFCGTTAGETTPKAGYAACASYCEKMFMEKYKAPCNASLTSEKSAPRPVEPKPQAVKPTQRVEQCNAVKLQQDSDLNKFKGLNKQEAPCNPSLTSEKSAPRPFEPKPQAVKPTQRVEQCNAVRLQQDSDLNKYKDLNKQETKILTKVLLSTIQVVQMLLTLIALIIYYIIYIYMNLIYFTLKSAMYFQQADAAMKATIGLVTLTSLVIAINVLTKLERLTGIHV